MAGEVEAVLCGAIGECAVAVVDVQHVPALHAEVVHARDEDVEPAVAVDIGHRDAALPADRIGDAGSGRDVLEAEVAQVAVQPVSTQVRGEVQVDQSIAIDVSRCDTAAIVVVQIVDDVDRGIFRQCIGERDAARLRRNGREERRGGGGTRSTTRKGDNEREKFSQGAPV